uniref:Uncharacterized protein n=1 Tax=Ficedula albicollis TaxID=59894 RepID=A0A803VKD7_FICAL
RESCAWRARSLQGRCPMPGSTLAQNLCSEGRKESSAGLASPPGTLVLEAAIGLSVYMELRRSPDPPTKCPEEPQCSCCPFPAHSLVMGAGAAFTARIPKPMNPGPCL